MKLSLTTLCFLVLIPVFSIGQETVTKSVSEFRIAMQAKDYEKAKIYIDDITGAFEKSFQWDSLIYYNKQKAIVGELTGDLYMEILGRVQVVNIKKFFSSYSEDLSTDQYRIFAMLDTTRLDAKFVSEMYQTQSAFYAKMEKMDSALYYGLASIRFADESKSPSQMTLSRLAQAKDYTITGEYSEAIGFLIEAERISNSEFIDDIVRLRLNLEMAQVLTSIGETSNALLYAERAKSIAVDKEYTSFESDVDLVFSRIYTKEEKFKKALPLVHSAYNYYKLKNMGQRIDNALLQYAYIYSAQGDDLNFTKVTTELDSRENDFYGEVSLLKLQSALANNNLIRARKIIVGLDTMKNLPARFGKTLYRRKSQYYIAINNYKEAYLNYSYYINKRDSLEKINQKAVTRKLEAEYYRKQQDAEIESLSLVTSSQEKSLAIRNTALILGSFMLLILGSLLYGLYRLYVKNQNNQKQLAAQNLKISEALSQNQMLIKEIHHRVKNNLQVISSLLSMQERKVTDLDTKSALMSSKNRVQSMSILHQKLYQGSNLKQVDVRDYILELIANIEESYSSDFDLTLVTDVDSTELDVDVLIPLGLIVNELVTNSIKHAFLDRTSGTITVSFKKLNNSYELIVSDDGIGLQSNELPGKKGSLGTRLIHSFARGLDGELEVENENGTKVKIVFESA